MKLNKQWHEANPMPKPATREQRLDWHTRHQQHCACRPIPAGLQPQQPPASSSARRGGPLAQAQISSASSARARGPLTPSPSWGEGAGG
jgi:hypothetical protein